MNPNSNFEPLSSPSKTMIPEAVASVLKQGMTNPQVTPFLSVEAARALFALIKKSSSATGDSVARKDAA